MENVGLYTGFDIVSLPIESTPILSITKKRRCSFKGCKTVLSVYNYGKFCNIHKPVQILEKRDKMVQRVDASKSKRKKEQE